jgi:WXXGXW repeat (2 copies)
MRVDHGFGFDSRRGLVLGLGLVLTAAAASACNSHRLKTRSFVAPTPCGQGPYDIHLKADGTTGGEGVEIVACTPRRLAGHVVVRAEWLELANQKYGDAADNQRCIAGRPTVVTTVAAGSGTGGSIGDAAGPAGTAGRAAAAPVLIERPFSGSETPFADQLCERLGLPAQQILTATTLTRTTSNNFLKAGGDLHVRLWSDEPNDLEGVVFMIRHVISKETPAEAEREMEREVAKAERRGGRDPEPPAQKPAPPDHGAPPAPLVEERPPSPGLTAAWTPGYWTWTGAAWGWVAGFWRDERVALPAPQVEVPGAPPGPGAIWIGGAWQLQAGSYVWMRGRWRR